MTDTFRALCAELVRIADALDGRSLLVSNQGQALDGYSALAAFRDVADRARAALAQPEPEGPTLDDIWELCEEHGFVLGIDGASEEESANGLWAIARAVLARWGNHPGSPDGSPLPIPVSERLPGPELCWWFTPESDEEYGWWVLEPDGMEREPQPTHWLPAHALPVPRSENGY